MNINNKELIKIFICLDCNCIFEKPKQWIETHGFECPEYENWSGCPNCSGAYTETIECNICGEYITSTYIEVNDGQLVCDGCYTEKEIGEC